MKPSPLTLLCLWTLSRMDESNFKTHYIFLIHGWMGDAKECIALDHSLQTVIRSFEGPKPRFVTHRTICNFQKTNDGIASGGTRLIHEIITFVENDSSHWLQSHHKESNTTIDHNISLSLIGNSLGGLYARFAISLLPDHLTSSVTIHGLEHMNRLNENQNDGRSNGRRRRCDGTKDNEMNTNALQVRINIHPMIFCTTATPHLGVAFHTYWPIPRFTEKVIGSILSQTGHDFFRQDDEDIIYELATNFSRFLKPLLQFRKRIAYINAFKTDFQVPTETAGFFSKSSSYPHSIVRFPVNPNSFLVLILETETNIDVLQEEDEEMKSTRKSDLHSVQKEIGYMSNMLNALGWTKVILDVRNLIPLPSFGRPCRKRSSRDELDSFILKHASPSVNSPNSDQKLTGTISSKDLARLLSTSERIVIPMGHTVMVANSKNEFNSRFNAKGKPIMDMLAKDIIEFIRLAV